MMHLLLAVLVLVGRLLGLPGAAQAQSQDALFGGLVICHAGDGPAPFLPDPAAPAGPAHDCQFCPACHLTGAHALSVSSPALAWDLRTVMPGRAAPTPPATGPPHPARLAARPTGPPTRSI